MALQKWLTARKAHAHAHARYVNFLHHLGLNFNDRNPAAQYWRTFSHGETGRRDDNSLVGGWTPARGPSSLIGTHSHKAFIDNLESVAITPGQGAGGLQEWFDQDKTKPKGYGLVNGRDGWTKADQRMTLMEDPFWAHRKDKNDNSYSGLYQLSQAGKAALGKTNKWGDTTADGVAPQNQVVGGPNYAVVQNKRDTDAPDATKKTNADNAYNQR